jgi:DNA-binding winged helix-turn-helix (wHTH) protein
MTTPSYLFGRCELRTGTRELLFDGHVRPLEPLAFELLVYLLRHRARDVPKDELLDEVWLGRFVSVGAVARAVMTVRKAIGDDGDTPLIRTVHRVGYRFAGVVQEVAPSAPGSAPAKGEGNGRIGVALLPFENLTGDLSLDWTTLGLMALVGNALALDARLLPLTVYEVSTALRTLGAGASVEQSVEALRRHGGVRHVVHTRIVREEMGFRLDYRLLADPDSAEGTVFAHDLIRLGRALARRLLEHLLPGSDGAADGFALRDPWAMQLFARAMQAAAESSWARAQCMLRVVLDIEPDYGPARCELERIEPLAGV